MRKENINDLASPGTQLLTQPPVNIILTDIEEDNMFTEPPQAELLQWNYRLGYGSLFRLRLLKYLFFAIPSTYYLSFYNHGVGLVRVSESVWQRERKNQERAPCSILGKE